MEKTLGLAEMAAFAGVPLLPWQKTLFERLDNLKPGERLIHLPPQRIGKTYTRQLFAAHSIGQFARHFA
jgi:hypothetical protein